MFLFAALNRRNGHIQLRMTMMMKAMTKMIIRKWTALCLRRVTMQIRKAIRTEATKQGTGQLKTRSNPKTGGGMKIPLDVNR